MLTRLAGGRVFDPANGIDGVVRDVCFDDGRIVADPGPGAGGRTIDVGGAVVMAGAIDMHTHIGGGKVNLARLLLPEDHRTSAYARDEMLRACCGRAAPSTLATGYRYAEMGYTMCFEPAMLPVNARQTHLEMGDTPIVDKGAYALLGNDDFLLRMLAAGEPQEKINDYVAWTLDASQAIAIKVVNPGGISAFKFNQRRLDVDEKHTHYGVTPRRVLQALTRAVHELQVPHALHVHGSNLGIPGNVDSTLATIEAADGLPIHLTHIQFHSYGAEGDRKFSSAAARIAEAINTHPNASCDVGQIMFGQTVTMSGDSMSQWRNAGLGRPNKSVVMDIECDAGCGVVPFRYRDRSFVNALQWAIGLEIFLLVRDPWRVFLTTDHPNGAPFTTYPHLIRLLMDRAFRNEMLERIDPDARAASTLGSLTREYSLYEIAIMTRAAPARTLGLADRGHLGAGASADVVVYRDDPDRERMFEKPQLVFKGGRLVVRDGKIVEITTGDTHVVKPAFDRAAIEGSLRPYFERFLTMRLESFRISDDEACECGNGARLVVHRCCRPGAAA
ncbi:MAG TPA: formylmethanofuran dehydrogenase subunit A [Burkholderiaceae bacterium]|nr:formylmethanofuran dehydrogenase subunit A [Burkholderiaceae bacterium]